MASFRGLLEVEGEPDSGLVADVDVTGGRITIKAAGSDIGAWELNDITIEESAGAFRIVAEDDALLLHINDARRFAGAAGIGLTQTFGEGITPVVIPRPAQRAPSDAPRIADEPLDTTPRPPSPGVPPVTAKVKGPDETPLARHLSWSLIGAAAMLMTGALLDWGPFRLTGSDFPVGRLLVVLAAFAAFAAAYLGLALEKRRDVALVAVLSGLIAVVVIIMYSRKAGIGYGFIVTILGAVAVITISVLALSHLGAPPPEMEE